MKIRALSELANYSSEFDFISFDLFDTLVFRQNLSLDAIKEASAYYFIGLLTRADAKRNFTVKDAITSRTQFTIMLKGSFQQNTEEPSIEAVYKAMAIACGVGHADAKEIAEKTARYELGLDCLALNLLPGAEAVLKDLNQKGKTLFLVSDMYYQKEAILQILEQFSIRNYFADVLVSATAKKTKQTGNLFRELTSLHELSPNEVLHVGDNRQSDVIMANKANFKSVYFASGTHHLSEKQVLESDLAALDKFGNISLFFVLQVLQRAWLLGLNKVFFLTRDASALGSLLEHLADHVPFLQPLFDQVELRELAVSRSTATFLELNGDESSLEEVLYRLCWIFGGKFRLERFQEFVKDAGCGAISTDFLEALSAFEIGKNIEQEADYLREEHIAAAEGIVSVARALGETTYNYLCQEGAIGQGRVGFVDVGYTATVTRNIVQYLVKEADAEMSSNTHIHLFFMASGVLLKNNLDDSISHVTAEYVMNEFSELPTILRTNYCWFECFAKDYSRGALLGYRKDGEKYTPVFESEREAVGPLAGWLKSYMPRESDMLRFLSRNHGKTVSQDYLTEMAFPSADTISYIDTLSHGCGLMDDHERSIINRDLKLSNFMPSGLREMIRQDYWIAGSIRASGFGNWAIVWVGSSVDAVRKIKTAYRSLKKRARSITKRALGKR